MQPVELKAPSIAFLCTPNHVLELWKSEYSQFVFHISTYFYIFQQNSQHISTCFRFKSEAQRRITSADIEVGVLTVEGSWSNHNRTNNWGISSRYMYHICIMMIHDVSCIYSPLPLCRLWNDDHCHETTIEISAEARQRLTKRSRRPLRLLRLVSRRRANSHSR